MGGFCCRSDDRNEHNGLYQKQEFTTDSTSYNANFNSTTWTYNNTPSVPSAQSVTKVAKYQKTITKVAGKSNIVNIKQLLAIISHIPCAAQFCTYICIYNSNIHGISLQTFFNQCAFCEYSVLIIKTDNNSIFGAFIDHKWNIKKIINRGTKDCFLYKFTKNSWSKKLKLKIYHSNNQNDFCLVNKNNCISIGEGYVSIYIIIFIVYIIYLSIYWIENRQEYLLMKIY